MSALIAAASARDLVEQVGSYAGYASVIGLGILALLYFTQAREVKRLREWAGRAPERAAELEQRVQEDAQRRVVAQPLAPATIAAKQSADARTAQATAAVYASIGATPPGSGVAAPGQLARPATPSPSAPGSVPAAPGVTPAPKAALAAPGAVPAAPGAAPAAGAPPAVPGAPPRTAAPTPGDAAAATPTPAGAATASPTPAPAPASATAAPQAATPAAAARVAAASRGASPPSVLGNGSTSQDTAESAAARPEPPPLPPAQRSSSSDDGSGFSLARVGMVVGGAIAAALVVIVLMVVLTGNDADPPPPNDFGDAPPAQAPGSDSTSSSSDSGSGSASPFSLSSAQRRATTVAVLNGTTRTGLARAVGDKIELRDFTLGGVATNADQRVGTTIVSYRGANQQAALEVAKIIGVNRGSVRPADANTTVAADADVVVTVGSDKIE